MLKQLLGRIRMGLLRGAVLALFTPLTVWAASPLAEYKIEKPPSWVRAIAPDALAALPQDKQSGGVSYLLFDRQLMLKGTERQSYQHLAMKIQNEGGLESAANISIRFDPSYQSLTLHSVVVHRGDLAISKLHASAIKILQRESSLEQLIYDGSKTANLFLEDVRVGDIVEYAYTVRGSNPVFEGKHTSQFELQWGIPIQHIYARLLTEKGRNPTMKLVNTEKQAALATVGAMQEYVWSIKDVEALRLNEDTPAWYDPYPTVQWSDFKDWTAVNRWATPLYKTPEKLGPELRTEVQRIKEQYSSEAERVVQALRFVQRKIRYLGVEVGPGSHAPTQPDVVLARRFGDCKDKTLLTLTLLHAMGIEAQAALVNTKLRRGVLERQPSPNAFDHVIVHAKVEGENYWLDATLAPQEGGLDDISQSNFGYALLVGNGQTALTEMKLSPAMTYTRKVLTVFDSTAGRAKPVSMRVTSLLEGWSAERLRSSIAKDTPENLQKQMVNYYARYYPSISVKQPYQAFDNKATNQITLVEHYAISEFWTPTKDDKVEAYAAIPDVNEYIRPPKNTVRTEPMALFHPADIQQTTYWLVPDQWAVKGGSSQVKDPVFDFESTASYTPGRLVMVDTYKSLADAIAPQNMAAYLANMKKARNMLGFTFTRPTKEVD